MFFQISRCERSGHWAMTLIHHRPRWKEQMQMFSALRLGLCNCWSKVANIARSDTMRETTWNISFMEDCLQSSLWGRSNGPSADRTTCLWENHAMPWRLPHLSLWPELCRASQVQCRDQRLCHGQLLGDGLAALTRRRCCGWRWRCRRKCLHPFKVYIAFVTNSQIGMLAEQSMFQDFCCCHMLW